jgi:hypothetical protein
MRWLSLLVLSAPLWAHHSFAAEYDGKKPITLTGTVTKIEWTNPHVYLHLDSKDASGGTVEWALEGHPPNTLRRTGWNRDAVKVGDTISVTGWMSKNGTHRMAGREVTFSSGKKLFLGPAAQ